MKAPKHFTSVLLLFIVSANLLLGQATTATTDAPSAFTESSFYGSELEKQEDLPYVTVDGYCAFLNAVAATDTHQLYDEKMGMDAIVRMGEAGSYVYYPIEKNGSAPISYVSWNDTARFCNWQENGSLSSEVDSDTTERGVYELKEDQLISSNTEATHFLFSEDAFALKATLPANCSMSFWGSPTPGSSLKPLFSFKNSLIEKSNNDPCLKLNRIGFAVGSLADQANITIDQSHQWTKYFGPALFFICFGIGTYEAGYHSIKNSNEPRIESRESRVRPSDEDLEKRVTQIQGVSQELKKLKEGEEERERGDLSNGVPYSASRDIDMLEEILGQTQTKFLIAHILSDDEEYQKKIAIENYSVLSKKADNFKAKATQGKKVILSSEESRLRKKITCLEELASMAERTADSYKAIAKSSESWSTHLKKSSLDCSLDVKAARSSLKSVFKNLSPLYLQEAKERFNNKFVGDNPNELTLHQLKSFVIEEKEQIPSSLNPLYWQNNPYVWSAAWLGFMASFSGIKSQDFFTSHVAPWESILMTYVLNNIGEYTSAYRQIPIYDEEAHDVELPMTAAPSISWANSIHPASIYSAAQNWVSNIDSRVVCSLLLTGANTSLSVTRNYPGNVIHDHVPLFIGISWLADCVNDLTRGYRQRRTNDQNVNQAIISPVVNESDRAIDNFWTQYPFDQPTSEEDDNRNDEVITSELTNWDLVKSAICKKFGNNAANRFQNQFEITRESNTPLTVGEFKEFLKSERRKRERDNHHFYVPGSSLDDLLQLSESEEKKRHVITSTSSRLGFLANAGNEEDEILEGIKRVRGDLKERFNDLNPLHQQDIITDFNNTFTEAGKPKWDISLQSWKKKELTAENLQLFINKHNEQIESSWNKRYYSCISNPYLCTAAWSVCAVTGTAVRVYLLPHHFFLATLCALAVNYPGDLCSRYRQLPQDQLDSLVSRLSNFIQLDRGLPAQSLQLGQGAGAAATAR